jgi:MOSC domain-containing protein YiiM
VRVLTVNVGLPRDVTFGKRRMRTAILKEPTNGAVPLRRFGFEGDGQADPRYHGGPDKAAYLYPFEHYAYWAEVLSRNDLGPGAFGENLTTEGLLETDVRIGDVYEVGSATVQVTQPRTPCAKLGAKFGSMTFVRTFASAGRPGFYLRVLREGMVEAGDAIVLLSPARERPTVAEVFDGASG